MNTQMMICMVIFAATLVSYMMNKIPMWLTAMLSLTALYFTGCIDATGCTDWYSFPPVLSIVSHTVSAYIPA
jgi:hypothetical protein